MKSNGRDRRPHIRPVTKLELSEKDVRKRTILAGVFLVIGIVAIGYGLFSLVNTQPGWVEVQISSTDTNISSEFTLMYDFSESGGNATAENKRLSLLYTEAVREAYVIFSPDEPAQDNLYALNAAPGEPVKVHPALYDAFRLMEEQGSRAVYLAPVYTEYDRVFRAEGDGEAMVYDPAFSREAAELITELTDFTADPNHIRVEVLEEGCLELVVSDAYLSYARENGIETFLEFGWLRNAFTADYLASRLQENGFTKGYLESFDGFIRNLDSRGQSYAVNIFHKEGTDVYIPARVEALGPVASVRFRAYPLDEQDARSYHLYADGSGVSGYIDPADGLEKTALEDLLVLGGGKTCAELALAAAPVFIAGELEADALAALAELGICTVRCEGKRIVSTGEGIALTVLAEGFTAE